MSRGDASTARHDSKHEEEMMYRYGSMLMDAIGVASVMVIIFTMIITLGG